MQNLTRFSIQKLETLPKIWNIYQGNSSSNAQAPISKIPNFIAFLDPKLLAKSHSLRVSLKTSSNLTRFATLCKIPCTNKSQPSLPIEEMIKQRWIKNGRASVPKSRTGRWSDGRLARGSSNRCLRVKALSILTVTSLSSRSRSYHFSVACSSPTASHDVRDLCPNSLFSFSAAKVSLESPYRFHFPASSSHTFRSPSFFLPLELLAIRSTITRLVSQDSITVTSRFNVNRIDHCL